MLCLYTCTVYWIAWLYRWYWLAAVNIQYTSIWTMYLCGCCMLINFVYSIKLVPWFQTAGFGVFAGRAFKQYEIVLRSWMTLFLPNNFPKSEAIHNYIFGHNKTHRALVLDYGSLMNHRESANTKAISANETPPKTQNENIHFQVRAGFPCGNHTF